MKLTEKEFHERFPGFGCWMRRTSQHPDGSAPGSMYGLVKHRAIDIAEDGTITVRDEEQILAGGR